MYDKEPFSHGWKVIEINIKPRMAYLLYLFSGERLQQTTKKTNNVQLDIQQALLNVVHHALCNTPHTEEYRRCGFHSFARVQAINTHLFFGRNSIQDANRLVLPFF